MIFSLIVLIGVFGGTIATVFGAIVLVIAAFFILWWVYANGFMDFFTDTLDIIVVTFTGVFNELKEIVQNVWGIITGILEGDWEKVWDNILGYLGNTTQLMIKLLMGVGAVIVNVFIFALNLVKNFLIDVLLGSVLWVVEKIFSLVALIPGLGDFGQTAADYATGYRSMLHEYAGGGANFNYISGEDIGKGFENVDKAFAGGDSNVNVTVNAPKDYVVTTRSNSTANI